MKIKIGRAKSHGDRNKPDFFLSRKRTGSTSFLMEEGVRPADPVRLLAGRYRVEKTRINGGEKPMGNNGRNPSELRTRLELSIKHELEEKELLGIEIPNKEKQIEERLEKALEKAEEISYPEERLEAVRCGGNQITTPLHMEIRHGSGDYILFRKARVVCRSVFSQLKGEWIDRTHVKERVKMIGIQAAEKVREIMEENTKEESIEPILRIVDGLTLPELVKLTSSSRSTVDRGLRRIGDKLRRTRDRCGFLVFGIKK